MKKLFFFILLTFQTAYSQIRIIDSKTGNPIAFAQVIVNKGTIGTSSNLDGVIVLNDIIKNNVNDVDKVTIQHISYENFELTIGELKNAATIKLNERTVLLNEVTVKSNHKTDYIVLQGIYRSYQLNNNVPKYYTDGIVEYYIPVKGNNLRFKVIEYRSFRNKELCEIKNTGAISVIMKVAGIPYIESGVLLNEIQTKYTIKDTGASKEITVANHKVGYIRENLNNKSIQICIDNIAPKTEKSYTLFGNTSRIKNIDITENYSSINYKTLNKEQLESRKEYRKLYFKSKKDANEELIESIHEFFTISVQHIDKKQFKKIETETDTSLKESHSYNSKYWIELIEKYNIPPLSLQIEAELDKTLILY